MARYNLSASGQQIDNIINQIENFQSLLEISNNLPWCSGYFQDRSIPAYTYVSPLPIVTDGDVTLVNDDKFVISRDGWYVLYTSSGFFPIHTISYTGIYKNNIVWPPYPTFMNNRIFWWYTLEEVNSVFLFDKLKNSDFLNYILYSSATQPTFCAQQSIVNFVFKMLTRIEEI